jgi:Xaa-Pro aminopeptidase
MEFETLTCAPIDLDGVDVSLLTSEEKDFLNNYHQMVFNKISPYLNDEEREFVRYYTRKI